MKHNTSLCLIQNKKQMGWNFLCGGIQLLAKPRSVQTDTTQLSEALTLS